VQAQDKDGSNRPANGIERHFLYAGGDDNVKDEEVSDEQDRALLLRRAARAGAPRVAAAHVDLARPFGVHPALSRNRYRRQRPSQYGVGTPCNDTLPEAPAARSNSIGVALTCAPPWNRGLNTNTPLSPGVLPAATTVGKPPSACANRSSEISWNKVPILRTKKRRAIRAIESAGRRLRKTSHRLWAIKLPEVWQVGTDLGVEVDPARHKQKRRAHHE